MDLFNDLKNEIIKSIKSSGINISTKQNLRETLIDYLNLQSKFLEVKPRKVLIVPELEKSIKEHYKKIELETIIEYTRKGQNLNIFLSAKIIELKYIDHLNSEWKIFHFHLGGIEKRHKPNKKFVKRSNNLLFAYIDNDYAVFLGIDKHENAFANIKWLEILEKNFPFMLSKYKPIDMPEVKTNFSSSDREKLWNNGVSTGFINLNGTTYLSPGIGKVTNGYNVDIILKCNSIMKWVQNVELVILNNPITENKNKVKLRITKGSIEVYDFLNKKVLFKY